MHFAKAEHLLAVLGNVLLCLNAGKLLALGAEVNVLFLAALSYLAALAELIVVGGYCAAAVTDDIRDTRCTSFRSMILYPLRFSFHHLPILSCIIRRFCRAVSF